MRRSLAVQLVVAAAAAAISVPVFPQTYPSKPIRKVLTIAGGGEANARIVAERLGQLLGVPILVESQAGAGGSIGATTVARAAPDGYTILYGTTGAMILRPFLVKDMPYDTLRDFTPISRLGNATGGIAANRDMPFNTLKEMIDYAKRNPGKVSYGSSGTGTTQHLAGVMIAQLTGADLVHVPYKGAPPAVTDLLGGRIQLVLTTMSTITPLVKAGKVKLLAIDEDRRMPQFAGVPTVFEELPGYDRLASWFGYFGPAGLPQPIVRRLATEIDRAAHTPSVKDKLESVGSLINTLPAEKFGEELKRQFEIAARQMKAAGVRPE